MKYKIIFLIFILYSCNNYEDIRQFYSNIEFSGKIDSVYLDPEGRMQPVVILNGYKYSIRNNIYPKFLVGDTLVKFKGSMKYYWIKDGDSILFYQQFGRYDLTDSGEVTSSY